MLVGQLEDPGRRLENRWIRGGAYLGVWTLLGLLSSAQFYLVGYLAEDRSVSWVTLLLWQIPAWYLWGAWAPLVTRLGRRFPLDKRRLLPNLLLHLIASGVLALSHLAALLALAYAVKTPSVRPYSFFKIFLGLAGSYFHYEILVYWGILGIGYAFEYYGRYRERDVAAAQLRRQLVEAQLEALKMQLHPHFLFNTLHAIAALVRKDEDELAIEMISRLSDLLRHVLEHSDRREVALREELEFVERYLEIQQLRYADRLSVRLQIAPDTLDAEIPSLVLQPLVENAVLHGIGKRANAKLIEIVACRRDGQLYISIRDDGPGLPADWILTRATGIGLANTRARLEQIYGGDFQFEVKNVSQQDGNGVTAMLALPFRLRQSIAESKTE